jgi:hypothetical protein
MTKWTLIGTVNDVHVYGFSKKVSYVAVFPAAHHEHTGYFQAWASPAGQVVEVFAVPADGCAPAHRIWTAHYPPLVVERLSQPA